MIAQFYQNNILKYPRAVFIILLIALFSFGYFSKDFRLDASSETLLIEGDPDLKYLEESYRKVWFKRISYFNLYPKREYDI